MNENLNGIKVGDKVRIIDSGRTFSTYPDWLFVSNRNGIDEKELSKYSYGRCPKENDEAEYTVQCISPHEWSDYGMLAYITSDCEGYIIGVEGIRSLKVIETKEKESKTKEKESKTKEKESESESESETKEDIINNFFATCQLEDIVKRIESKVAKELCIKIMKEKW